MGFFSGIFRTILFIFNLLCLIVGIALMAVGGMFYVSIDKYYDIIDKSPVPLKVVPSLTIAVGVFVFLVAFFGCCGAMKESSCMLMTYAIILIIILIIQLSAAIYGFVQVHNNGKEIEDIIKEELNRSFKEYKTEGVKQIFDSLQAELQCCGVNSSGDYKTILNTEIPASCCELQTEKTCSNPYPDGCAKKLFNTINNAIEIVAIVAIVICGIELLGSIFAICIVRMKN